MGYNNEHYLPDIRGKYIEKASYKLNKLGFKSKNLKELDYFNNLEARLVAPDGLDGRFFLVFKNYKSILYYNCSHYYALTVGLLSDKIK